MGYVKVRVNAGGMTQNQVNMILRLEKERAWDLHPSQKMREFYAMHIGDVESNPATSVLTGGWNGTASALIERMQTLPKRVSPELSELKTAVDEITELLKPDPWGQAVAKETGDPWSDDATTKSEKEIEKESRLPAQLVGPGVYVLDGAFYSVKESTKNPGRFYAHRIVMVGKKFKHDYAAGVIYKLTEEMRASADVIVAMNRDTIHEHNGKRVGSCCVCGRMLTKKASIDAGIGPVCGGRVGL